MHNDFDDLFRVDSDDENMNLNFGILGGISFFVPYSVILQWSGWILKLFIDEGILNILNENDDGFWGSLRIKLVLEFQQFWNEGSFQFDIIISYNFILYNIIL